VSHTTEVDESWSPVDGWCHAGHPKPPPHPSLADINAAVTELTSGDLDAPGRIGDEWRARWGEPGVTLLVDEWMRRLSAAGT
jgi:hypothetical protein